MGLPYGWCVELALRSRPRRPGEPLVPPVAVPSPDDRDDDHDDEDDDES